jgi:CRISPR-associated protein Csb3
MHKPHISVTLNGFNPAQYYACLGLFEIANCVWPGVEAWFTGEPSRLQFGMFNGTHAISLTDLVNTIAHARVQEMPTRVGADASASEASEKKTKTKKKKKKDDDDAAQLNGKGPIELRFGAGHVHHLLLDWWCGSSLLHHASRFKTWTGQARGCHCA